MPAPTKIALFSKEYPPAVYGGAGVSCRIPGSRAGPHDRRRGCAAFGDQVEASANLVVRGYPQWAETAIGTDPRFVGAVDAFARSLAMAKDRLDADIVHCHTWYTDMAGVLASQLWGVPYVLTIHSLEPLRPWKVEQLGRGYHLSAWMERTAIEQADAIIAVSNETREDVLRLFGVPPERVHVIHNGIDPEEYRPTAATDALVRYGIDPARPYLLFVGRITRQKGIIHLVGGRHRDGRPGDPGRAVRRVARHAGDRARDGGVRGRSRPARVDLDPRARAAARRDPALQPCRRVLLPFRLRAVRHHQPGGDGLRDGRRRLGRGGHPRGGHSGRDGGAGGSGIAPRDVRASRPGGVLRRFGGGDQPRRGRCCARAAFRGGRTAPGGGTFQLGRDRRGQRWRSMPRCSLDRVTERQLAV